MGRWSFTSGERRWLGREDGLSYVESHCIINSVAACGPQRVERRERAGAMIVDDHVVHRGPEVSRTEDKQERCQRHDKASSKVVAQVCGHMPRTAWNRRPVPVGDCAEGTQEQEYCDKPCLPDPSERPPTMSTGT